ncbi:MAG: glycoside hydrolase family 31 protein [Bacillota bacterium]|nr:glycoside hydrolase family 31 protein [Bacillota bacterium]
MSVHKVILGESSQHDINVGGMKVGLYASEVKLSIKGDFQAIFGLGERFNSINHIGCKYSNLVEEQFCNQKNKTYFPLPFFYTDQKWGIFIETPFQMDFDFTDGIEISFEQSAYPMTIHVFEGPPMQMISDFIALTGEPLCPPKWAFGPWISGHRWNSSKLVDEQLDALNKYNIPVTAMVLEQWSDEATFYIFNQAQYTPKNEAFGYEDFSFDSEALWPDPKGMIEKIHDHGLKLLLWQCPVIKKLDDDEPRNSQHAIDEEEAIHKQYIPMMPDGTPYTIPSGHWFPGSMIPDFTSMEAQKWWFDKRQYLLDIGVDGFKTDGGEFIYKEDCIFSNGSTGRSMVNQYAFEYVKAYSLFCGEKRTLFSRAGYIGQQQCPIQWAGDQESTWSELKSVFNAGISVSSSGQLFWGFDIGGFSGELPSVELYKRAVQFAVFTPIMQLHSEPIGGQFSGMRPTKKFINDRTPWNMAEHYEDDSLINDVKYYFNLRMNLLPTIYCEALKAITARTPLMQQGLIRFPEDENFIKVNDQYFFGNILVAPVLNPGQVQRSVYFPSGRWFNLFSHEEIQGGQFLVLDASENEILAFVQSGSALVLNLGDGKKVGDFVDNVTVYEQPLTIRCFGAKGQYHYMDSDGNDFEVKWENQQFDITGTQINEFDFELI